MKNFLLVCLVLSLLVSACAINLAAQTAPASGVRAEFLSQLATLEKKYVSLAEAIPADKYTWRPGEGVRSVSEVFLHVAGANFGLPRMIGAAPPASFQSKGFETSTTDKAKVAEALKQSFAHYRQVALGLSDADTEKNVKLFGTETTYRGFLFFTTEHLGEHLGQMIAYARVNGIVPPWTEERMRQQPAAKKPQ